MISREFVEQCPGIPECPRETLDRVFAKDDVLPLIEIAHAPLWLDRKADIKTDRNIYLAPRTWITWALCSEGFTPNAKNLVLNFAYRCFVLAPEGNEHHNRAINAGAEARYYEKYGNTSCATIIAADAAWLANPHGALERAFQLQQCCKMLDGTTINPKDMPDEYTGEFIPTKRSGVGACAAGSFTAG